VIFEARTVGETSIPAGSRLPLVQFEDIIQTLSQNQPLLFSDYRTIVDPRPGIQRLLKDGLLSTCSLPLFSQGSLIGMFSMHSEIPGFFDDERISLGREVANQVAIAITQNQLVEGLRESEDRYHSFFQNSMDAILLTAPDGTIQAANPAACKMFGRTEAEICELGRNGLVDQHDPRLATLLAERTQTGKSFGELTMLRKDGSPFPVEISSSLFVDKYGNSCANMIVRDITERVLAEKKVAQMRRLYATLSQVNQSIVHIKSQDELFQSICDVAVKFGEFSLAWVGLLDEDTGNVSPVKATGLDLSQWPFPIVNIYRGDLKNGLIATALRTDKVKISEDMLME
jgi:PAS domain S-box-containing protein